MREGKSDSTLHSLHKVAQDRTGWRASVKEVLLQLAATDPRAPSNISRAAFPLVHKGGSDLTACQLAILILFLSGL